MLVSIAYAAASEGGGAFGSGSMMWTFLMYGGIIAVFYFLLIRPQQRRMKAHQEMVAGIKKGDTIVTAGGLIGKVKSVQDDEVRLELAPNVDVRVVRSTITDVRGKTEPAPANDTKPSSG